MALVSRNFSDIVTFTRASAALAFNSSGVLTSYATNLPRLDYTYNGSAWVPAGFLVEEQRTNLLTYSEQFDNAAWTKANGTVTANAVASPDGTTTADKYAEDTATGDHNVTVSVSASSSTAYTLTVFAKAAERSILVLSPTHTGTSNYYTYFDLSAGTVGTNAAGNTASITSLGGGWYRCTVSRTTGASQTAIGVKIGATTTDGVSSYTGATGSGLYLWGAQLEAGSFATSYIPTTTAQVTRSADVATINTLSPWFSANEGTFFVEAVGTSNDSGSIRRFLSVADVANTSRIVLGYRSANARLLIQDGGVTQADIQPLATAGTTVKFAGAYKANDFAASAQGAAALTDTAGTVPTGLSVVRLGADDSSTGSTMVNGWIRKIIYYPTRKTNAELATLTA